VRNKPLVFFLLLLGFYFTLHLFRLTQLPVFADEAIYIRWSQLIIDDFGRYLFYPMNDGKTPFLMWLTVPFLNLFDNQLLAARLVSVIAGGISVSFIFLLLGQFKQKNAAWWAMLLAIISPFTFFYHRLALTDGLLLTNLIAAYYFTVKIVQTKNWFSLFGLAFFFFLGLWSKTPALLFAPVFYLTVFLIPKLTWRLFFQKTLLISAGLLMALIIFYSFRVVPLFSQLFAVGGNFLQEKEVIFSTAIWPVMQRNASFFFEQLVTYLGPVLLILSLPLFAKTRRLQLVLLASALLFLLPLIMMGKIIYPRYILPSSFLLISSAAISLGQLRLNKFWFATVLILLLWPSLLFMKNAYFNVDQLSLSPADREQFLEEWSSGHGIKETSDLIIELAQTQTVAVATEGYFGTLPDGILLNLHNQNVDNIYVEGIGQPVRDIPESFLVRAASFDRKLLVVNSHRIKLNLPEIQLLANYCRPNQAPCLQIWELKEENFR
jgi:4-amino-4-deoxy-L-arabinose transferase-like glycosyltransferase